MSSSGEGSTVLVEMLRQNAKQVSELRTQIREFERNANARHVETRAELGEVRQWMADRPPCRTLRTHLEQSREGTKERRRRGWSLRMTVLAAALSVVSGSVGGLIVRALTGG